MAVKNRSLLACWTWVIVAALPGNAAAQTLPSAPVPVIADAPPGRATIETSCQFPAPPGPYPGAMPPTQFAPVPQLAPYTPYEDQNGPLLRGDPLLDRPEAPPGWFAALEANVLGVHIKNRVTAPVLLEFPRALGVDYVLPGTGPIPITNQVQLPTAELEWAGAPRIELGYRFAQGFGEILVSYRSLVSTGQAILTGFDVDGSDGLLDSRLNMNVVDLDYASREYSLGPCWDMKCKVGARFASVYFDSRATGNVLEQRTSNDFRGAGPHLGLDLRRRFLEVPGLGFYSRLEGAALLGEIKQSVEETFLFSGAPFFMPAGRLVGGGTTQRGSQAVPVVQLQVGLSWTPPWAGNWLQFVGGYEIENWWYLGQLNASRAELLDQGVFFRAEWSF